MHKLPPHGQLNATVGAPHIHAMINLPIRAIVITMILAVTSCDTAVQPHTFAEQTFSHLEPISLDVADIDIVHLFSPPLEAPHIEHEMPLPPHKSIKRWIADRIRAVGASGRAVITIRDASVLETRLKRVGGIKGLFTTRQSERYDARVEVEISAVDGRGIQTAKAIATSSRSRTIPEDATLRERQNLWFELTERVMMDFDRAFEAQIRKHLSPFLK